ncbi:hypothetical protein FBULB1_296 [Fusarium bulbicola]|nr:hypothetical protein FBULB1_296 [Fusarium bulbicola]
MAPSTVTPFPYADRPRKEPVVRLEEKFNDAISRTQKIIKMEVLETYPDTESHMMRVSFKNSEGDTQIGVLKLFDRRYAGRIRQIKDQVRAPSLAAEAAYLKFVRQGKMCAFSSALEHIYKTAPERPRASHFLDNQSYGGAEADRVARFEAATWHENDKLFKTELRAYKQLESLQGDDIPRLFAHVRIPHASIDHGARDDDVQWDEFFCVHGLLLEHIEGPKLRDWPTRDTATKALKTVAQRAALAMDRINKLGILLEKYSNNVIVKDGYRDPLIFDFAEAVFKKDLVKIKIKQLDTSKLVATEDLGHRMDIAY